MPKAEKPIAAAMASSWSGEEVVWIGGGRFIVSEVLGTEVVGWVGGVGGEEGSLHGGGV